MIISHKHKYIFVGLPFSASSAISNELLENYEGEPILSKHANLPLLIKQYPTIELSEYFIFLVVREPSEIVFSKYNKLVTNAYNVYTDSTFFLENGGFVSKADRAEYEFIRLNSLSYSDFLRRRYRTIPYDNALSLNKKYVDGFLKFENLVEDFNNCLQQIGLNPLRDLPIVNRTNKVVKKVHISPKDEAYFYPFKYSNRKFFRCQFDFTKIFQLVKFKIVSLYRYYRWNKFDSFYFKNRKNKSMVD